MTAAALSLPAIVEDDHFGLAFQPANRNKSDNVKDAHNLFGVKGRESRDLEMSGGGGMSIDVGKITALINGKTLVMSGRGIKHVDAFSLTQQLELALARQYGFDVTTMGAFIAELEIALGADSTLSAEDQEKLQEMVQQMTAMLNVMAIGATLPPEILQQLETMAQEIADQLLEFMQGNALSPTMIAGFHSVLTATGQQFGMEGLQNTLDQMAVHMAAETLDMNLSVAEAIARLEAIREEGELEAEAMEALEAMIEHLEAMEADGQVMLDATTLQALAGLAERYGAIGVHLSGYAMAARQAEAFSSRGLSLSVSAGNTLAAGGQAAKSSLARGMAALAKGVGQAFPAAGGGKAGQSKPASSQAKQKSPTQGAIKTKAAANSNVKAKATVAKPAATQPKAQAKAPPTPKQRITTPIQTAPKPAPAPVPRQNPTPVPPVTPLSFSKGGATGFANGGGNGRGGGDGANPRPPRIKPAPRPGPANPPGPNGGPKPDPKNPKPGPERCRCKDLSKKAFKRFSRRRYVKIEGLTPDQPIVIDRKTWKNFVKQNGGDPEKARTALIKNQKKFSNQVKKYTGNRTDYSGQDVTDAIAKHMEELRQQNKRSLWTRLRAVFVHVCRPGCNHGPEKTSGQPSQNSDMTKQPKKKKAKIETPIVN